MTFYFAFRECQYSASRVHPFRNCVSICPRHPCKSILKGTSCTPPSCPPRGDRRRSVARIAVPRPPSVAACRARRLSRASAMSAGLSGATYIAPKPVAFCAARLASNPIFIFRAWCMLFLQSYTKRARKQCDWIKMATFAAANGAPAEAAPVLCCDAQDRPFLPLLRPPRRVAVAAASNQRQSKHD